MEASEGMKLIFACSGAADVGEVADQAARKLTKEGVGNMFCLAGVGGRIGPIMDATGSASAILAIDGCSMDCAKSCLEQASFSDFKHLQLGDIGLEKGTSPANKENVEKAAAAARGMMA